MSNYRQFIFKQWNFDQQNGQLELHYSIDNQLNFTETYKFNFEFIDFDQSALERAINNLFIMCGVSYYKTYLPPEIVLEYGKLDDAHAAFFAKTYQLGLGELFYLNNLNPRIPIKFPVNATVSPSVSHKGNGALIGLGGGKDSLVSVEMLRNKLEAKTWALGHRSQLEPLTEVVGLHHLWVERQWDRQLLELNKKDTYKGHVPISAIFACVGTVAAILSGSKDVIVSNERSADAPTLTYQGAPINHQYSKSSEFERDFQALLKADFGDSVRYYSLLRPLSELRIAELFAKKSFDIYSSVFSSCNRAFTHYSNRMFWCGTCPKCAFVFLILTPFIERKKLETVFGKNMLTDPEMKPTYEMLLGIQGDKPLECVGEVQESRVAMHMAQQIYPELRSYHFELNDDYDYRALGPHQIPDDIKSLISFEL